MAWIFSTIPSPQRYALIHREKLIAGCGFATDKQLHECHRQWLEEALHSGSNIRQPGWTESIAVGSEAFVQAVQEKLGLRAKGRKLKDGVDHSELREPDASYDVNFVEEKPHLRVENQYYWN